MIGIVYDDLRSLCVLYELNKLWIFDLHVMVAILMSYFVMYLLPCCCLLMYSCCMCQSMMIKMFRDVYDVNLFKLKVLSLMHTHSMMRAYALEFLLTSDEGLCPGVYLCS